MDTIGLSRPVRAGSLRSGNLKQRWQSYRRCHVVSVCLPLVYLIVLHRAAEDSFPYRAATII